MYPVGTTMADLLGVLGMDNQPSGNTRAALCELYGGYSVAQFMGTDPVHVAQQLRGRGHTSTPLDDVNDLRTGIKLTYRGFKPAESTQAGMAQPGTSGQTPPPRRMGYIVT